MKQNQIKPLSNFLEENSIKLNDKQLEFMYSIAPMLVNPSDRVGCIVLDAPAGTGKTFLVRLLRKFINKSPDELIYILAPTNKACSLIEGAKTIHSFMGSTIEYDEDGSQLFNLHKNNIIKNAIIICDECSMINHNMFENFIELSASNFIIFTGDTNQIPPVKEHHSPVFNAKFPTYSLTESMRSTDSRVGYYNTRFMKAIHSHEVVFVDKVRPTQVYDYFKTKEDNIVLVWTNQRVREWNTNIRRELFQKHQILDEYYVKEQLVFSGYRNVGKECILHEYPSEHEYDPYVMDIIKDLNPTRTHFPTSVYTDDEGVEKTYVRKENNIQYYSNDVITIHHIQTIRLNIPFFVCPHQDRVNTKRKFVIKKCDQCKLKGLRSLSKNISYYCIVSTDGSVWYVPYDGSKDQVNELLQYYKKFILAQPYKTRTFYWRSYYLLQNRLLPALNYVYASTVHKSQGSQWKNVFVDIDNIRRASYIKNRLTYTAVSRAMNNIFFV